MDDVQSLERAHNTAKQALENYRKLEERAHGIGSRVISAAFEEIEPPFREVLDRVKSLADLPNPGALLIPQSMEVALNDALDLVSREYVNLTRSADERNEQAFLIAIRDRERWISWLANLVPADVHVGLHRLKTERSKEPELEDLYSVALARIDMLVKSVEDLRESREELPDELQKQVQEAKTVLTELIRLKEARAGMVGESSAERHAQSFRSRAGVHLVIGVACMLVLLLGGSCAAGYIHNTVERLVSVHRPSDLSQLISVLAPGMPYGFLFVVAVLLLARAAMAEFHNAVTFQQKASALSALHAFRAAAMETESQDIRNAILLQTTSAIFTITPSGYSKLPIEMDGGVVKIRDMQGGE